MRRYQREWIAARRRAWHDENGPCVDCGSWENPEVDHVDASLKVSCKVWSWSQPRREAELAKCVSRCHSCHVKKTVAMRENARGERIGNAVLTAAIVAEARELYGTGGHTWRQLGERYGVKHDTLRRACKDWWKDV